MADLLMKVVLCAILVTPTTTQNQFAWVSPAVIPISKFSNLFYLLVSDSRPETSVVTSPVSAAISLGLLSMAAEGETREELEGALYMISQGQTEYVYSSLIRIMHVGRTANLTLANKVYFQAGYTVGPQFKTIATNSFKTEVEAVNFIDKFTAAQTINTWVENKTNSTIKNLVKPSMFTPYTRLVLVNALYFQASWFKKFETSSTINTSFFLSNGKMRKLLMMNQNGDFRYGTIPELDAKVVEMPYKQNEFSMAIILPNKKNGMTTIQNNLLASTDWNKILNNLKSSYIKLSIPKFKTETEIDLTKILPNLGIELIFDRFRSRLNPLLADFKDTLYVTDAIQKIFIDVNEEGTTAAAATAVVVGMLYSTGAPSSPKISFVADHPFLYLIRDNRGHILFMGCFTGQ